MIFQLDIPLILIHLLNIILIFAPIALIIFFSIKLIKHSATRK